MNYPKVQIKGEDSSIQIEPSKIPTVKELEAFVKEIDIRTFGSFENKAIFLANKDDLGKYDFYLTVDDRGYLVLVLAKK